MSSKAMWLVSFAFSFLSLVGRVEATSSAPVRSHPAKDPSSTILARVNGVDITRAQLDRKLDMMIALLKNKKKSMTPEQIAKFKKKNLRPLSNALLYQKVLETGLASSNITANAVAEREVKREFLRKFGKRKQSWQDLVTYVRGTGFEKDFNDRLAFEIRLRSFLMTAHSNEYYVTQADLEKVKADVAAYNKRASETNKVTLAHADDIMKRARAGEDFAKLATRYSQDKDQNEGGDLGDCDESDFAGADQHVWKILNSLKAGDISDVLQTEEGYVIYKVVRRNTAEQSQTGSASITLSRIFFRCAYLFPEQTEDELQSDVEQEKREKLTIDVYKAFRAQSKVSYPNGPVRAN